MPEYANAKVRSEPTYKRTSLSCSDAVELEAIVVSPGALLATNMKQSARDTRCPPRS